MQVLHTAYAITYKSSLRCCVSLFLLAVNSLPAVNSSLNTATLLTCRCVSGLGTAARPSMNVTTAGLQTSSGSTHSNPEKL